MILKIILTGLIFFGIVKFIQKFLKDKYRL